MSILPFRERVVRSLWRLAPQRALSQLIGWSATRNLPGPAGQAVVSSFARQYGINVDEAEKPLSAYGSLQEFFTRKLRADARPLPADPNVVVSSADGRVVETGIIRGGQLIDAKGVGFSLATLIADEAAARRLEGGAYAITYLSPRDYHRVHTPVGGTLVAWHHVPGLLFPVNERSVAREPMLFSKNERLVTVLEGEAGLAAVVMVAAVGVGHMTASYDPEVATHDDRFSDGIVRSRHFHEPITLNRGDEIGIFNLGSTTIVVFEPGRVQLDVMAPGTAVKMGAPIGRILPRV
ncbi:MAG TPA: archaetidylserine decarboxylase [Polyangia bacterium]